MSYPEKGSFRDRLGMILLMVVVCSAVAFPTSLVFHSVLCGPLRGDSHKGNLIGEKAVVTGHPDIDVHLGDWGHPLYAVSIPIRLESGVKRLLYVQDLEEPEADRFAKAIEKGMYISVIYRKSQDDGISILYEGEISGCIKVIDNPAEVPASTKQKLMY